MVLHQVSWQGSAPIHSLLAAAGSGKEAQQSRWMAPLLGSKKHSIRRCLSQPRKASASADATVALA
jgi:hypothetical protein